MRKNMINKERLVETFVELVKIDGKSGNEKDIAQNLVTRLKELGLEVKIDNAGETFGGNSGNVIGYLKGNYPEKESILLSAHMDTVEDTPDIKVIIEDEIIKTDGNTILGADDRAGVACILETLKIIKDNKLDHPPIYVVFSVAEEIGMWGAKNISPKEVKAKYGFIFDSSAKAGKVITEAPTSARMDITIRGKSAHAAVAPENGINAIKIAGNAIARLNPGRFEAGTFNIGTIKGGKATNIVPDCVEIAAECRSFNNSILKEKIEEIKNIFKEETEKLEGEFEFDYSEKYNCFKLEDSNKTVQIAFDAIRECGVEPESISFTGGSDANIYSNLGIPTVNIGTGYKGAHTHNEQISISDLFFDANVTLNIVKISLNK